MKEEDVFIPFVDVKLRITGEDDLSINLTSQPVLESEVWNQIPPEIKTVLLTHTVGAFVDLFMAGMKDQDQMTTLKRFREDINSEFFDELLTTIESYTVDLDE